MLTSGRRFSNGEVQVYLRLCFQLEYPIELERVRTREILTADDLESAPNITPPSYTQAIIVVYKFIYKSDYPHSTSHSPLRI